MNQPPKTFEQLQAELNSLKRQNEIRKLQKELEMLKEGQRQKKIATEKLRLETELANLKKSNVNRNIDLFLAGRATDLPKNKKAFP